MLILNLPSGPLRGTLAIPASKSESNRALLIAALAGGDSQLNNLSSARDTQTMQGLLAQPEATTWDVGDAGTVMRFLTAYAAILPVPRQLVGTARMHQRPIAPLVEALRSLGADIRYEAHDGFPPLRVFPSVLRGGRVNLPGDVSSQFVSALLMIGPTLSGGLSINLEPPVFSRPYIEMTRSLMKHFGVEVSFEENTLSVAEQAYKPTHYSIESDWSSAGYWYSLAALRPGSRFALPGLRRDSWQGDARLARVFTQFGVTTQFDANGATLASMDLPEKIEPQDIDFRDIPDQAQTLAVAALGCGVRLSMRGLASLRIKETDRIAALQRELQPFGGNLTEIADDVFALRGSFCPSSRAVRTYEDHRMALAFAPFAALQQNLQIENPAVVAKSYPEFWQHLAQVGGQIQKSS